MNKPQWLIAPMGISQEEISTSWRSVKLNELWQVIGCCPLVDLYIKCRWYEALKLEMHFKVAIKQKQNSCILFSFSFDQMLTLSPPWKCVSVCMNSEIVIITWCVLKLSERNIRNKWMMWVNIFFFFFFVSLITRSLFCHTERNLTVNMHNYHLYLTVCYRRYIHSFVLTAAMAFCYWHAPNSESMNSVWVTILWWHSSAITS